MPSGTSRPEGCEIDLFPSSSPPYAWIDVAILRSSCNSTAGRGACIERLKAEACRLGGDALNDFEETAAGGHTKIAATVAAKDKNAPPAWEPRRSRCQGDTSPPCASPCSGGFECDRGTCIPLCGPGMACSSEPSSRAVGPSAK